jgi:two-component system CheB/CheR fusion protein
LQSTNEELETAKEEIQATNEELNTTNEELRSRNLELHQVNNDLTNLLASINIPILMLTNDLRIRRFTPMAQRLFNFIPADAGRPLSDIRANLNIPDLELLILEVLDTLSVKELEVQTQEGQWYNLRIRPYRTIENQIDGVVLVLVDIDALKRSTEQIKASRDYAEAIVETIREPLVVLDANLRVNTANLAFYETFQVSQTKTENNSIFELGNGQWDIPQLRSLLEELLPKNNQINDFEVEHVFEKIGRKTMLLNACKILRTDNQEMILLVIQDITLQKLLEEQRKQLLTHEQAARTAAEAANWTKDDFLSIVSHELRNPLNSMLGWTQLLRRRRLDAGQIEQALEMVERSVKAQAKLVNDLLDISGTTTGKLQLNLSGIALVPVIEAATNLARPLAEDKNIQIETVLAPETIEVLGDPDRLQQVIGNLLSNAIKFTPVGGRVTVKLERIGSIAQIQVSDTGQGISADFLPYIFERFRQANSSRTRTQGGLGLGLSIVHDLVELHGGTVRAASPGEGQGATFTVHLPLLTIAEEERKNFTPSSVHPISPPLLDGLRILVVDDEAGILELLKTILEQSGAQVTAVASAKEAIAVLTANLRKHDVLLSDIGMPDEDGYALIRQVRALGAELGGQIPAVALTAYVRVEEQSESLAAGFQRHIAKPVELAQLVSVIAELAKLN